MRGRRWQVLTVVVVMLVAGGGTWAVVARPWRSGSAVSLVRPTDRAVTAAEAARQVPGAAVRQLRLVAEPATVNLGGRTVRTWTFNGTVPGPQITIRAGDRVHADVVNRLPAPLSVHWHGIAIRNDMDGVPDLTQQPIRPGATFSYSFVAADPGTYFYHSHVGTQLDRGLYGALIVQPRQNTDPTVAGDVTVLLDDWVDGTGRSPDDVYTQLRRGNAMPMPSGSSMPGMDSGSSDMSGMPGMEDSNTTPAPSMSASMPPMGGSTSAASPLGADTADLDYPTYLVNGRTPDQPAELTVPAGRTVRLRLINAASATPFRVAVGGRAMTVVATDGYPVDPVRVDTLIIGMGERYDVLVTAPRTGTAPLVAVAEGRAGEALAVLRSGPGTDPMPGVRPNQLSGRLLALTDLHATAADALPARAPDRTYRITLTGAMNSYNWGITTNAHPAKKLQVRQGQRIRLLITNNTMMWHPMHLHGHTFQVDTGSAPGPRKDTVIVPPMSTVTVDFDANNPGQWLLHCHNIYHAEAGMMTTVSYVK